MRYEIDQSGKVEQTNLDTIIACTNNRCFSLVLKKKDKRVLQSLFKKQQKLKRFQYELFSLLLAMLIKEFKPSKTIHIDHEYLGYEDVIRERVGFYLKKLKATSQSIRFIYVGKSSRSHELASRIGSKKSHPSKIVTLIEVKKLLF